MARIIFTTLGALLNLVQLALPFWAWATGLEVGFGPKTHPFGGWEIGFYFIYLVAYFLLVGIVYITNDVVPLTWWFASPKKRIYHSEFGVLWAEVEELNDHSGTKVMTIWKQYWLFSKRITYVEYTDNRDLLISRTKTELDSLSKVKKEKVEKKSKNPAFDDWDGYIDKQSKRDDKLNGIGI